MWMTDPRIMCDRHLLGEHCECHMLAGCIKKGKSLAGYLSKNLFDPASLTSRHDRLAEEMTSRGFAHRSPILNYTGAPNPINISGSLADLLERCPECKKRYDSAGIS